MSVSDLSNFYDYSSHSVWRKKTKSLNKDYSEDDEFLGAWGTKLMKITTPDISDHFRKLPSNFLFKALEVRIFFVFCTQEMVTAIEIVLNFEFHLVRWK